MAAKKQLSNAEIAFFCNRLSLTLKAGLPPEEGLYGLNGKEIGSNAAATAAELCASTKSGKTLATAIKDSGVFPKYAVEMTRIGEAAGQTDDVLAALANFYEQSHVINKNIRNAVFYPLIMAVMMLVVLVVLIVKVLPIFNDVYLTLGSELKGAAAGLLSFATLLSENTLTVTVVFTGLLLVVLCSIFIPGLKQFCIRCSKKLFVNLHYTLFKARFASSLALMLKSGMNIDESLAMTMDLIDDDTLCKKIYIAQKIMNDEGESFSAAIRRAELFTGLQCAMLELGSQAGVTDEVMLKIAGEYEEELEDQISRMVGAIEPTIVAILSILVGLVLLSVIMPLMGVMSSL